MSLTSFLKDDGEVKILLDEIFENPEIEQDAEQIAEPRTRNYSLVGTAFDYLARFRLEKMHANISSKPWVAETGFARTQGRDTDVLGEENAKRIISEAEDNHRKYLKTGKLTDELIASTLDLARFDWVYRSGKISENFGKAPEGDILDLRQLYNVIPESEFNSAETVLLNPTFGSASKLVSGADADIILDDTLLDIKTVKSATVKQEYWRQLIGYVILADLAFDELEEMPRLSKFGIYFSRHGIVWTTPTAQVYNHEKYDQFKEWFRQQAKDHFSYSSDLSEARFEEEMNDAEFAIYNCLIGTSQEISNPLFTKSIIQMKVERMGERE